MSQMNIRENGWYGYRRDVKDARDHLSVAVKQTPPTSFDLRDNCAPVMNQMNLGSCVPHGVTAALRYLLLSQNKPDVPLARLQLYYDARAIEGTVNEDSGAEIRDAIKCTAKIGVAHETLWPYIESHYKREPTPNVYADAMKFEALTYERVRVSTIEVKRTIAFTKVPVVIGLSLYSSFESDAVANTGVVPMPDLTTEQLLGGHCMLAVGYGQVPGHFTVRNSWDVDWGDHGDCYLPYHMVGSTKYGGDYWAITKVE